MPVKFIVEETRDLHKHFAKVSDPNGKFVKWIPEDVFVPLKEAFNEKELERVSFDRDELELGIKEPE